MTRRLGASALRELFLFEKLSDEQLAWLAERGEVRSYPAGVTVYAAGEPATTLFVLLEGTLSMTVRAGGAEVETLRTDYRGAYAGAFFAYLDVPSARSYTASVRAVTGCRFWELPAADFGWAMREWFSMATHLLEGFATQGAATQEMVSTRERLVALGTVTAGLTHELNNPATAAARAAATLHGRVAGLWDELAALTNGDLAAGQLATLVELVRQALGRRAELPPLSPLQASDREDELGGWLEKHGVTGGWDLAAPLVAAGVDAGRLEQVAASVPAELLPHAVAVLAGTCEAESLLDELAEAAGRISSLIGAAKQYTQMDRSPLQQLDVHDGLESTLTMLGHKLETGIEVVRDYDRSLPKHPAYAGELNQVWTNLIDNAIDAMDGGGVLTVRTGRDGDRVLVEIGDTGPGIPEPVAAHVFEPFFSTKPVGKGTGLGLDICWRIVVQRHGGELRFTSTPGDTRFQVLLPTGVPPSTR
ncbi:MAG TPA: ATP-binding protein [Actinomycetes bacterium]|nr:ATP-binding protein [Actinomycetes bacterium]